MESKKMKSESVVPGEQKKTEFALGKTNIILIAVAFVAVSYTHLTLPTT